MGAKNSNSFYETLDRAYAMSDRLQKAANNIRKINEKGWFDQKPHYPPLTFWQKIKITSCCLRNGSATAVLGLGNALYWAPNHAVSITIGAFAFGAILSPREKDPYNNRSPFGAHIIAHAFHLAALPVIDKTSKLLRAWTENKDPRLPYTDASGQLILPPNVPLPNTRFIDVTPSLGSPILRNL